MYITDITDTIDVPGHPGHTITIRRLTRKQQRKARDAKQKDAVSRLLDLGGAKVLKEINEMGGEKAVEADGAEKKKADALQEFDADVVLDEGVTSLDPMLAGTRENALARLDEGVAEFIAREIIAFTRGEREADKVVEKND